MATWEILEHNVKNCKDCPLNISCTNKVIGQGNKRAKLMIVGEAPGKQEDEQGLAFVGSAGQLLTKMLASIRLKREDVYICNVVKCRPPNNRQPDDDEIKACIGFLRQQFKLVNPYILLLLGSTAVKAVLGESFKVTKCRGVWFPRGQTLIMASYHPAALLYDDTKKADAWEDLKLLRKKLDEIEEIENS